MAIRSFRLTYIDARRPYGVAGCDTSLRVPRLVSEAARGVGVPDLTEASRAIHGYDHEPQTIRLGGDSVRLLQLPVVFRQDHRNNWHCAERLHGPGGSCGHGGGQARYGYRPPGSRNW